MSQHILPLSTHQPKWLPPLDVACTALAATLWVVRPEWGAWVLLLAVAPWILRWWQIGHLTVATPLTLPLCLFMVTAVIGLWVSYNSIDAWAKFWLLVASAFLFYTLVNQPANQLWLMAKLLTLLCICVAGYFLLTHNWQSEPTYIGSLDGLVQKWMEIRPSIPMQPLLHNQIAGLLSVLIPFGIAIGLRHWRNWSVVERGIASAVAALVLFALLLTGSWSAWLALIVALIIKVWSSLSYQVERFLNRSQTTIFAFGLGLVLLIGLIVILLFPDDALSLANKLTGFNRAYGRAAVYDDTVHLLGDFPFTGSGLDTFSGLYSQYILVIPYRFFTYAYNLYLDVALEQGILGLVALIAMLIGSLWLVSQNLGRPEVIDQQALLHWAIISGLIVMVAHGLIDDALYSRRGTTLLWVLPGLAIAFNRATIGQTKTRRSIRLWVVIAVALAFLAAFTYAYPLWRASWYANLGAVQMAQIELADWPTNKWDDGHNISAFQGAEQLFIEALQIDPANRTAHYRLGMIAMLKRDFVTAVAHLEAAYQADKTHGGIRKSLAYSYIWNDQLDDAQALLSDIPEAPSELDVYTWWWTTQEREDLARQAGQMLVRLEE